MGYEKQERKQPCFCGESTITSRWSESDWPSKNSDDMHETMDCPECAKNYHYKAISYRSDDHSPRMAWVHKDGKKIYY